jgi:hypothetical protein
MPNIDTAYQFIELEGNTASTNGIVQILGTGTEIFFGNATVNSTMNSTSLTFSNSTTNTSISPGLINFGASNTANQYIGYITLPGGVIMNYGGTNANSTGTLITLGLPFITAPFSIGADSNTVASTVAVTTANTTKVTITSNTTTNVFCYWQAWGM